MDQKCNVLLQKVACYLEQVKLRRGYFIVMCLMPVMLVGWHSLGANLSELTGGVASEANLSLALIPTVVPSVTTISITSTTISSPQATSSAGLTLDHAPLLVDSEDGWLYTSGLAEGKPQTLVLSAVDGRLVRTYDITGWLELDPVHNWLYIDRGSEGVAVLEAQSGHRHATISLPQQEGFRALQADPSTGHVFVSSRNVLYVADPQTGALIRSIPFNIPKGTCDGLTDDPSPIRDLVYDSSHQLLYLSFASFGCTPWYFETLVSFDLAVGREIARADYSFPQMTAFNGYLYGADWYRFGIGYRWAWRDGRPWVHTEGWSGGVTNDFQVDARRQRLYESVDGNLRVFDAQSMELLMVIPQPVAGELVGYDSKTDQLYFWAEGRLQMWSVGAVESPQPQPLLAGPPPAEPANFLVVSPHWPEDKTLLGLWGYQPLSGNCYAFGQSGGGSLYISSDNGSTWGRPNRGLPANCDISTVALSPDYSKDQTILVAVKGWGLFRSTDGGQAWTPSNQGLSSMALRQILLSPGFAHDRIAFTRSNGGELYRSDDGGQRWQLLAVNKILHLVAMSPEFEQDHILMGAEYSYKDNRPQTTLYLSRNEGYHWEQVGQPLDGTVVTLKLAPLFDKWHVVFAFSDNGMLYRSSDGGLSWEIVIDTGQAAFSSTLSAQLVFAPNIEVNRPVFFLMTSRDWTTDPPAVQGSLYRSGDGGLTWQEAQLPDNIVPTALAVSPDFAQDGLLLLGTAEGQVKIWQP